MTNFEKWKAGLTLESMAKLMAVDCIICPFDSADRCTPSDAGNYDICEDTIREWGEQEAQDE